MDDLPRQTRFLNVDLDIDGSDELVALVSSLGSTVFVLRQDEAAASLELSTEPKSLEGAVLDLAALIDSLTPRARKSWEHCKSRVFNVGLQAGSVPHAAEFELSNVALSRLVTTGASLRLTIYADQQVRDG